MEILESLQEIKSLVRTWVISAVSFCDSEFFSSLYDCLNLMELYAAVILNYGVSSVDLLNFHIICSNDLQILN